MFNSKDELKGLTDNRELVRCWGLGIRPFNLINSRWIQGQILESYSYRFWFPGSFQVDLFLHSNQQPCWFGCWWPWDHTDFSVVAILCSQLQGVWFLVMGRTEGGTWCFVKPYKQNFSFVSMEIPHLWNFLCLFLLNLHVLAFRNKYR